MENTRVLSLMWKYIEDNGINWAKVQKMTCSNSWMDAHEWSDALEEKITSSRLVSMYNAGLVDRIKNKAYFGDDRFHYFPITIPDNNWN